MKVVYQFKDFVHNVQMTIDWLQKIQRLNSRVQEAVEVLVEYLDFNACAVCSKTVVIFALPHHETESNVDLFVIQVPTVMEVAMEAVTVTSAAIWEAIAAMVPRDWAT